MVPPPSTDKGELTRKRILEVAARHLLSRGYNSTSLNELIKETGLTKGGFYFHFASKAELAVATIEMIQEDYRVAVFAEAGVHARAVDQIAAMVRAVAHNKQDMVSSAAMGRVCQELAVIPGIGDRIKPFDAWYNITADLCRRAQAQGDMDPTVDPEKAAQYAVTAYLGLDHVAEVHGDLDFPVRHVEDYLTFTFIALGITVPVPATDTVPVGA